MENRFIADEMLEPRNIVISRTSTQVAWHSTRRYPVPMLRTQENSYRGIQGTLNQTLSLAVSVEKNVSYQCTCCAEFPLHSLSVSRQVDVTLGPPRQLGVKVSLNLLISWPFKPLDCGTCQTSHVCTSMGYAWKGWWPRLKWPPQACSGLFLLENSRSHPIWDRPEGATIWWQTRHPWLFTDRMQEQSFPVFNTHDNICQSFVAQCITTLCVDLLAS